MKLLSKSLLVPSAAGLVLAVAVFLSTPARASATNVYIAQSAAGASNGQDCADAYVYTFFNSSSNWGGGAGKIGPGTTVHLCGTFTASAGANSYLQFQGSGANGAPITLLFETGAILQAPYFGASGGAIDTNGNTNLTINGGTNGVLQDTANGSNLANQQDSFGIAMSGCNGCVVENLTIANLYVHASVNDSGDVSAMPIRMLDGSNITIGPNNTIHDGRFCVFYAYSTSDSNLTILGNTVYNCDHGVAIGNNPAGTLSTVSVHDNIFHDWVNWDDTQDAYHHNAVHIWSQGQGSAINGFSLYNNSIYGDMGIHSTSMFYDEISPGVITGLNVFNNVFNSTNASDNPSNGLLVSEDGNCGIYNNTFQTASNQNLGNNLTSSIGINLYSPGCSVINNIFNVIYVAVYLEPGATFQTSDYNDFHSVNSFDYQNAFVSSLSSWRSKCACDSHSITGNPALNSSFVPPVSSPVVSAGTNLSSLGIAALDSDKAGMARATLWSIGAYGTDVTLPAPPTALSATVH